LKERRIRLLFRRQSRNRDIGVSHALVQCYFFYKQHIAFPYSTSPIQFDLYNRLQY
jgi:hypothetical protein